MQDGRARRQGRLLRDSGPGSALRRSRSEGNYTNVVGLPLPERLPTVPAAQASTCVGPAEPSPNGPQQRLVRRRSAAGCGDTVARSSGAREMRKALKRSSRYLGERRPPFSGSCARTRTTQAEEQAQGLYGGRPRTDRDHLFGAQRHRAGAANCSKRLPKAARTTMVRHGHGDDAGARPRCAATAAPSSSSRQIISESCCPPRPRRRPLPA